MPLGPGKYDKALTLAKTEAGATSAILVVFEGENGAGMACQATIEELVRMPAILRAVAKMVEDSLPTDIRNAMMEEA